MSLKIMPCGDSITEGFGGSGNQATGWREAAWQALRSQRGNIEFVGHRIGGRSGGSQLGSWSHAAQGGKRIDEIDSLVSSAISSVGIPDVYVILAGTNDAIAGASSSTMLSRMSTLITARLNNDTNSVIYVCSAPPIAPPQSGASTYDAVMQSYNSGLPSLCDGFQSSRVRFIDTAAVLSKAVMDSASGIHPRGEGYRAMGKVIANRILSDFGVSGAQFPRRTLVRQLRSRLALTIPATDYLAVSAATGLALSGSGSFSLGIRFRPDDTTSGLRVLVQTTGAEYSQGVLLAQDGTTLSAYVGSSGPAIQATGAIAAGKWHTIGLVADASRNEVKLYCLREGGEKTSVGALIGHATGVTWSLTSGTLVVGHSPGNSLNGVKGLVEDYWISLGTVNTLEDMERWYCECTLPPGVTAWYPLDDGTGTSAAPCSGVSGLNNGSLNGAATWSSSGSVSSPWDPP